MINWLGISGLLTAKLPITVAAGLKLLLPGCEALMIQVPVVLSSALLPLITQTDNVNEAKLTGKPESAVATKSDGGLTQEVSTRHLKMNLLVGFFNDKALCFGCCRIVIEIAWLTGFNGASSSPQQGYFATADRTDLPSQRSKADY